MTRKRVLILSASAGTGHLRAADALAQVFRQRPEVEEVLTRPGEDRLAAEGARIALGQTTSGRYLRVVYVPDPEPDSVFVITA